jgi:L-ascorbate metabolism protein UlaG (beta-lactamase superfamily)
MSPPRAFLLAVADLRALWAGMAILLAACGPVRAPSPGDTPSQTPTVHLPPTSSPTWTPEVVTLPTSSPIVPPPGTKVHPADPSVHIWSLGGNGWALRIRDKMLVFDYVGAAGPTQPASGEAQHLQRGYIDPYELRSLEVYVFVTHSHQDHFDPGILEWDHQIDQITYFFGWQAGGNPEHHYMIGPRAHTQSGGVEVYTVNSHSDVPEVAYLVKVDGITIYHNGDYRGSYVEDFEYLHTITDQIDIAFVIGWPYVSHQNFQQAKLLAEMFNPTCMFAICREGDEDKSREFAELLAEHGLETNVLYAEHRGDDFICSTSGVE